MPDQQEIALDEAAEAAAEARRLKREVAAMRARLTEVEDELALYTDDVERIEAMSARRFNQLTQRTIGRVTDERKRAEAINGACWRLLHEWERLGRGDGTHGEQLRAALESQDVEGG